MATTPLIDLDVLQRDWIVGTDGGAFCASVQQWIVQFEDAGSEVRLRGVMLVEVDPVQFAAAFFAAVSLRLPVILANPKWQRVEWEQLAQQVNPAVIVGNAPISEQSRADVQYPESATILIPTGGSSGGVKLAIHTWETLTASCAGIRLFLGGGPIHSCCVLPLFHVSGLMQLIRSYVTGGQIVFPDFHELQAGVFPVLSELCLSLVPTQLQRLMAEPSSARWLASLRAIFIGGSAVPVAVVERARALRLPVVLSYGMTETAAMVAALDSDDFLAGQTNVGRPLGHARISVMRVDGRACAVSQRGRVRIETRSLFRGYRGRPEIVGASGYLTDDEGYFDAAGRLHIVGRCDRLIISGGEKVDPQEVERAILKTGKAREVLVVGMPDSEWGARVVGVYVAAVDCEAAMNWVELLGADLAKYKIPKQMIAVAELPLNERGKVDRSLVARLVDGPSQQNGRITDHRR